MAVIRAVVKPTLRVEILAVSVVCRSKNVGNDPGVERRTYEVAGEGLLAIRCPTVSLRSATPFCIFQALTYSSL